MRRKLPVRAAALVLALTLALSPAAGAITVDEARDMLRENYIDEIPEEILALPTIEEITAALGDPYTYYMTAESTLSQNLKGLAVEATMAGVSSPVSFRYCSRAEKPTAVWGSMR